MKEFFIKQNYYPYFKSLGLFALLLTYVLLTNIPTISYSMVHFEQAPIYIANQMITSFSDLLNVYLHPKMLYYYSIYFFRPSGHFLMYQLLTPLLGWHSIKGFIIVNLVFLTLSGYLMIRIYQMLFPGFLIGGYLAFSIYLMHPALLLSRLMTEHFDFAYIFFLLLSLYYFIQFCKKNQLSSTSLNFKELHFSHFSLLALTLLFYVIAITFKDSALMLGGVLISYFLINFYDPNSFVNLIKHRQAQQIIIILGAISLALCIYLTLPWPNGLRHPLFILGTHDRWITFKYFSQILTGTFFGRQCFLLINDVQFPMVIRTIIWFFYFLILFQLYYVFRHRFQNTFFKRSFLFLAIAAIIFLSLPLVWARAKPWHLNPTIVFISLIMGFSFESLGRIYLKKCYFACGMLLAILIGMSSMIVTYAHINVKNIVNFSLQLNHNAIYFPPHLPNTFNTNSILVVAVTKPLSDYFIGAGFYPYYPYHPSLTIKRLQDLFYVPVDTIYGGDLFRWAYLMPNLKEMSYPFKPNDLSTVPDFFIYIWARHFNDIFCISYDKQANWIDASALFKKNLLLEQKKRHINIHSYANLANSSIQGKWLATKEITAANTDLCQMVCDKDKHCNGFTYALINDGDAIARCNFFSSIIANHHENQTTSFIRKG